MLTSINPLGERARGNRWLVTALFYVVGSTVGGAAVAAAVAASGSVTAGLFGARNLLELASSGTGSTWAASALVAGLCALAALADATAVPTVIRRQVDEEWLTRYRGWVYGTGFGLQLGAAVTTTVTTAAVYLMLALSLLDGSPTTGAAVGACFGATRAVPVLATAGIRTAGSLRTVHARIDAGWGAARRTTVVALFLTAVAVPVSGLL